MENILTDPMKFECIRPASSCDNTSGIESRLQKCLLEPFRADLLSKNAY